MNERLRSYAFIAAGVLLISLMCALLVSRVAQRVISTPVVHLAETARMVSHQKNYSVRVAEPAVRTKYPH